jgi:hypothetical protein
MRTVLSSALEPSHEEPGVDRILAAAFFRKRPLQSGSSAEVVDLETRRALGTTRGCNDNDSLSRGGRR